MKLNRYSSVVHATQALQKRGYTTEFKLKEKGKMQNLKTKRMYSPSDMEIAEFHRFEGASNPSDMSIVFAVEAADGAKGIIVSSYGMYADMDMVEFMDKVKIKKRATA